MQGFWVGYAMMQIPGGWLTTRWGPRRVVGCGPMSSSVMHLLMPWAAVAFVLYSLVWPIWLFWILRRNRELIKEDQLLRAMDLGETRETNPDAYEIRKRYHKMPVFVAVSLACPFVRSRERSLAVE